MWPPLARPRLGAVAFVALASSQAAAAPSFVQATFGRGGIDAGQSALSLSVPFQRMAGSAGLSS